MDCNKDDMNGANEVNRKFSMNRKNQHHLRIGLPLHSRLPHFEVAVFSQPDA
tara:strand:+ start:1314 stop:1469 length:156 start_codon:yes stop_codon:yes gene_type:complete